MRRLFFNDLVHSECERIQFLDMLNYTETKLGMNETFKATILDAHWKSIER